MDRLLDDYQVKAKDKLKNGSILCGQVGSGKSRTALAYYFCNECGGIIDGIERGFKKDYIPMTKPKDLYIITTAKKRDSLEWEGELVPFLLSTNPKISQYGDSIKVVVDSWNNIKKYSKVFGAFFIFDEQRVVGKGAWVKAFLNIARKNHWILLTATPGDVWSDYIPVFVANGFYKNRTEFLDTHAIYNPHTKYPSILRYVGQNRLCKYRSQILVTMDYTKPTTSHNETIMVSYDKSKYRFVNEERWDIYKNEPCQNAGEFCYVLRRIINSDQSRLVHLADLLLDHPKAIIFYNFNYELDLIKAMEFVKGTSIAEWNGHKHEPIPTGSKRWVYLVQYMAGAEGWNCTETDTIIFYSQTYSYRMLEQAKGRIDRRNTPYKDLFYYHLRSNAPLDSAILYALKQKKDFNAYAFSSKIGS